MGLTTDYQLGELEQAIMEIVWQHGSDVTVRDVHRALLRSRSLAYTTVMTVMSRLVPKGILAVQRRGRTDYYWATGTREDVRNQQAQRAVQHVLAHFGDAAVNQFLREMKAGGPEHLARLQALLDEESADG